MYKWERVSFHGFKAVKYDMLSKPSSYRVRKLWKSLSYVKGRRKIVPDNNGSKLARAHRVHNFFLMIMSRIARISDFCLNQTPSFSSSATSLFKFHEKNTEKDDNRKSEYLQAGYKITNSGIIWTILISW